jgi:hypothetical protein
LKPFAFQAFFDDLEHLGFIVDGEDGFLRRDGSSIHGSSIANPMIRHVP